MAKVYEALDDRLRAFIAAQQVYFVATAPSDGGHVNVSPKGHADTLAVLDDLTIAYLDLTGSGAETAAHIRDNGRVTVMFCAFDGPPNIVRLYGRGCTVTPADPEWPGLAARFPARRGARAIVVVALDRISDSCGYGVPLYTYEGDRDLMARWAERKSDDELADYHATRNAVSIDGLPALPASAV